MTRLFCHLSSVICHPVFGRMLGTMIDKPSSFCRNFSK